MPWTALSILFIGFYSRVLRSDILETMGEDYVRTARAKGLSERRVLLKHVLRNSLIPIITLWGLDFGAVIGGAAILTESVFNLQGVGQYAAESIGQLDLPPIMAVTMFGAFFIVVFNTLVDIAYAALDPRIRLEGSRPPDGRAQPPARRPRPLGLFQHRRGSRPGPSTGSASSCGAGEVLAVVGESGSGKSVTATTLMGLTRGPNATISGSASFEGTELVAAGDEELRRLRGDRMAMIFQDPMSSLDPVYRVADQIVEQIRAHRDVGSGEARERAIELLDAVGIPDAASRADSYPHEFSGGMRQRAMIAMALSLEPALLIADEPTTALDVTVQAQIIDLLREAQPRSAALDPADHPRHRRRRRDRRPRRGHVRGADRRVRDPRRDLLRAPAPLHLGPARTR